MSQGPCQIQETQRWIEGMSVTFRQAPPPPPLARSWPSLTVEATCAHDDYKSVIKSIRTA